MDAFYASVELLERPDLRGHPVVIGGRRAAGPRRDGALQRLRDYAGRGVVTTATYEARALGVSSGMGIMKAAALAPEAILLPADFDAYRHYSHRFKTAVGTVAPRVEDRGIDEIYVDLTDLPESSIELGLRLKAAVREATGLTCSIGLAPNKLLAKICSELDKPDGLTVLAEGDLERRIWPLPAGRINGVGPKAAARLTALGILTIGDLARAEPATLRAEFGPAYGAWLVSAAQGIDDRPVVTRTEPKSVSRETTFERDLHPRLDRTALADIFRRLCERVADDLRRKGYRGRTVGIKLRYDDFRTVTRDLTLPDAVGDAADIRRAAGRCLQRVRFDRRIRLLGVRVSALEHSGSDTRPHAAPHQTRLEFPR
jgi:DNA polymerase IV